MILSLALFAACSNPDIADPPLSTETDLPVVGVGALQFYGQVPKNLIFLSIDTFRKDHVGVHGGGDLTPFIDRIAREGLVLEDFQQCSNWTYASTTCTLAGRTNIERGHMPRLSGTDETRTPVPIDTWFLARWLDHAGYATALVSANDWLSPTWGNTQGYDRFDKPGGNTLAVLDKGRDLITEAIRDQDADRFFLHMHHMEPHAAYSPPDANAMEQFDLEPFPADLQLRDIHYDWRDRWSTLTPEEQELLEAHLRVLYAGEIRTVDERLAENWQIMEDEGYLNDTLVVIWNDHGEAFWEHGNQTHAYMLYGPENDGFAIFWSRNIVPGTWSGPTHAIDLTATLLELYGIDKPPEVTGIPVGLAPDDRLRFSSAVARKGGVNMVTKEGWKLTYRWNGEVTLYDRNTDPDETTDLYAPDHPKVVELWPELRAQAEQMEELIIGGDPAPIWPSDLP
jgi:arylsulfatase A-like enzyme